MENLKEIYCLHETKKSAEVLGFEIFCGDLAELVSSTLSGSSSKVINTLNPYSYLVSKRDQEFEQALLKSDVLLADGMGGKAVGGLVTLTYLIIRATTFLVGNGRAQQQKRQSSL